MAEARAQPMKQIGSPVRIRHRLLYAGPADNLFIEENRSYPQQTSRIR